MTTTAGATTTSCFLFINNNAITSYGCYVTECDNINPSLLLYTTLTHFVMPFDVYHLAGNSLALLLTFNRIYKLLKYYPSLSFFTYSAKSRAACITGTDTVAEKGTVKVLLRTVSHKFLKI